MHFCCFCLMHPEFLGLAGQRKRKRYKLICIRGCSRLILSLKLVLLLRNNNNLFIYRANVHVKITFDYKHYTMKFNIIVNYFRRLVSSNKKLFSCSSWFQLFLFLKIMNLIFVLIYGLLVGNSVAVCRTIS